MLLFHCSDESYSGVTLTASSTSSYLEDQSSDIEASSSDLDYHLSTYRDRRQVVAGEQQQQVQQQQQPDQNETSQIDEKCDTDLNPNCMPATTTTTAAAADVSERQAEQQETTVPPEIVSIITPSSSLEDVVTTLDDASSIVEPSDSFCSGPDTDCSLKPTAAMLTREDVNTVSMSSTATTASATAATTNADHFLALEASRQSGPKYYKPFCRKLLQDFAIKLYLSKPKPVANIR